MLDTYVEGQNLIVHYRSADARDERLPELAQLIRLNVDVIVLRGTPEVLAVKNATSTIPVVMSAIADPVGLGVVASLSHLGGNITGLSSFDSALETKRIGLLKELVPEIKRVTFLGDFRNPARGGGVDLIARLIGQMETPLSRCAPMSQRIDNQGKRRRRLPATWIKEVVSRVR